MLSSCSFDTSFIFILLSCYLNVRSFNLKVVSFSVKQPKKYFYHLDLGNSNFRKIAV